MAFSAGRSISQLATKLVSSCRIGSNKLIKTGQSFNLTSLYGTQRNLTRSIWYLSNDSHHVRLTSGHSSLSKSCGCCHIHTQGDQELADFLREEIKVEKSIEKSEGQLPRIKGFDVELEGADVTLKKKSDNETVVVTFNINNTVDAEDDLEMTEQDPDKPPEMVSKPTFVVEINKGGPTTLALQCSFPPPEDASPEGEQQYEDVVEIQEVALVPTGKDWVENTYCVNAAIMDGNLYDLLLNTLEDRGIDAEFADQLMEFSTALEHQKYIGFLEGLSSFTSK